ncbi:MAG: translation elongation factor Ts, partial [Eubacteriaceae bacterium]|nr:translation elongation factor Ts [Eubacteriaceae bacterium]
MVTSQQVKDLREKTGAGMLDCKNALAETDGNVEKAVVWLREKGLLSATKKSGRIAAEGAVGSYVHMGGKIGVLVEVNCETDFVARNEQFSEFVKNIAMHVAAANPRYVSKEDVPQSEVDSEKEVLTAQALNEGKPANITERIVAGRIDKFYEDICLLEQKYVKNPDVTIANYLKETISIIGENIVIRRFARYQMGEGLVKKSENFA